MLVAQGVPVVNTDLTLCTDAAVGSVSLDEKSVPNPAKLSKGTIDAFWGPERELMALSTYDSSATARSNWGEACILDFADTQAWPTMGTTLTMAALESTTARCGIGRTPVNRTISAAVAGGSTCLFYFQTNEATARYFIFSYDTTYTGYACGTSNAGRSWGGSTGNGGCNVTRWYIR